MADRLGAGGARCQTIRRGAAFHSSETGAFTIRPEAPEDWRQLLATHADGPDLERILYLWNRDTRLDDEALFGTDALLHLAQALETVLPTTKLRIDAVTRGAQPVGRDETATAVAQAPAIGLLRVIQN